MAESKDVRPESPIDDERGRDPDGLRRRIESERQALGDSLDRLGGRVRETVDWRLQASRHRNKLLAAGGGLALAGLWRWRRRRRNPMERLQAVLSDAAAGLNRDVRETFELFRRGAAEPPRQGWFVKRLVGPLAIAMVRQALARGDRDERAEAERPTPADAPDRGNSAGWNQEEHEWNRESSSTIRA